jgi:CHASE3 domain sensor protein
MNEYTQDSSSGDWEFKIVRSDSAAFRNPEVLKKLVEEEARAGWVMLEKFDDNRVRFKRPRSARAKDAFLPDDVDPYRTQYGGYAARRAVVVGVILIILLLGGAVSFLFVADAGSAADSAEIWARVPIVLITVIGIVMLLVVKLRRLR